MPAFTRLPDLALRGYGGAVIAASDESFAEKEALVRPGRPAFQAETFGNKGQVYDGWETRRRRTLGHDWAIIRLGLPGTVRGVVIDTAWFKGNFPPHASVEACEVAGAPSPEELATAAWVEIVPRADLKGDAEHHFEVRDERRYTHVRLNMYPDGGIARLRVHGEVRPDLSLYDGLQTVSWLVEGEVLHRDSLGSLRAVRPGQLNLMTAGRGISHSEESAEGGTLHGVQLWVALPEEHRGVEPAFEHHAELPVLDGPGYRSRVLMGGPSPATAYTPLIGAEVSVDGRADLAVEPGFEHGLLLLDGAVEQVPAGPLLYLPPGRERIVLEGRGRVLLIGGEPFAEEIVMWWNFVGRSHDDIAAYREEWMRGRGFGVVRGFDGEPLPAPELPGIRLKPRGRVR
ncbi:pirin family protein [Nonomuraea sp. NPDC055795]